MKIVLILRHIFVGIVTISLVTGCSYDSPPDPGIPTSTPVDTQPSVKEVRFFLDATESMLGFAAKTSYLEFMKDLEDSVTELPDANLIIHKYKFATNVDCSDNSLDKERLIDIAKQEKFYKGTEQVTKIDNVLNQKCVPNDQSTLSVIISDLFQEGTDLGSVVSKLEPYLKQGLAVGLIGVKSDFQGNIWDYVANDSAKKPIQYNGLRPVYALVVGDIISVKEYFEAVKGLNNNSKINQNFTIFSSRLFDNKVDFFRSGISPLGWSSNLTYTGQLGNTPIHKFIIKDDASANFTICASQPTSMSEDLAGYEKFPLGFDSSVAVDKIIKNNNSKSVVSESVSRANEAVKLEEVKNERNEKDKVINTIVSQCKEKLKKASISTEPLVFKINIIPRELQSNSGSSGHYLVSIIFKSEENQSLSKWNQWSTGNVKSNPSQTFALERFITNLHKTTITIGQQQRETALIFYLTKPN